MTPASLIAQMTSHDSGKAIHALVTISAMIPIVNMSSRSHGLAASLVSLFLLTRGKIKINKIHVIGPASHEAYIVPARTEAYTIIVVIAT